MNIAPSAETLRDIALQTASFVRDLGIPPRVAMVSFSSSVYPGSSITSIRSRSAGGTGSSTFAVVMKSTSERSNGTSR